MERVFAILYFSEFFSHKLIKTQEKVERKMNWILLNSKNVPLYLFNKFSHFDNVLTYQIM